MDYFEIGSFVIVVVLIVGASIYRSIRKRRSESWTTAQATLEGAKVFYGGEPVKHWTVEVTYSYAYEGEFYAGRQACLFSSQSQAEGTADNLLKGMKLVARINPKNPGDSFLRDDDNRQLEAVRTSC